jgi:beta-lactamase superfamily II metal-dependent hydrolase
MKYEYEVLKLGDADAIFIRHYVNNTPYVILIDAGNVEDWTTIKSHLRQHYGTYTINLAICTHPDNDHMGGFFGLLNDSDVRISEFWLIDPAHYLDETDIKRYSTKDGATKAIRKIFDNQCNTSQNLINMVLSKHITTYTVIRGYKHDILPIEVVAPTADYYREVAKEMAKDCNVHSYVPADTSSYDEAEVQSIDRAKSSIDQCDDDCSPYNKSSIVLLYEPGDGQKILFTGDACCASLLKMTEDYPRIRDIDFLKVPHHGSKHNLSSAIIDTLRPKTSFISAKGSRTHPSVAIVNYLSRYGNVFSTHKHNSFIRKTNGIERQNTSPSIPLKAKQNG